VNRMEEAAACARILVVEGGGALHRHPALIRAVLVVVQGLRHVLHWLRPLVKYGVYLGSMCTADSLAETQPIPPPPTQWGAIGQPRRHLFVTSCLGQLKL
jgi:hypothetical protein